MHSLAKARARRHWSVESKRALVGQTLQPGETVSGVARRHGINPSMLFSWRKRFRDDPAVREQTAAIDFAAIAVPAPNSLPAQSSASSDARVDVEFASGVRMTLIGTVDPALAVALAKTLSEQ